MTGNTGRQRRLGGGGVDDFRDLGFRDLGI